MYYAIELIYDAHLLLDAGADPKKFGVLERDPFQEIERYLRSAQELLAENDDDFDHINLENYIKKMTSLKEKMLSIVEVPLSQQQARKTARLLAQAARNQTSFFSKKRVPPEILAKIAADTRSTKDSSTQEEIEAFASKHLCKPKNW